MVAQGADHQINVIDLPEGGFAVDSPLPVVFDGILR